VHKEDVYEFQWFPKFVEEFGNVNDFLFVAFMRKFDEFEEHQKFLPDNNIGAFQYVFKNFDDLGDRSRFLYELGVLLWRAKIVKSTNFLVDVHDVGFKHDLLQCADLDLGQYTFARLRLEHAIVHEYVFHLRNLEYFLDFGVIELRDLQGLLVEFIELFLEVSKVVFDLRDLGAYDASLFVDA